MSARAKIKKIQTILGFSGNDVDGLPGRATKGAFESVATEAATTEAAVIKLQSIQKILGFTGKGVDGIPGKQTRRAFGKLCDEALAEYRATLSNPSPTAASADISKVAHLLQKNNWPTPGDSAMTAFYGQPGDNHTRIVPPYDMFYEGTKIGSILCNRKVAASLSRILTAIWEYCDRDQAKVKSFGLHNYDGCFNNRMSASGNSRSRHAWAAAIDLDADRNAWKMARPPARMPQFAVEIFKAESWKSGGEMWGHDWMHFQATR